MEVAIEPSLAGDSACLASANAAWQRRSLAHIWHPCTQMQRAALVPPLPIARGEGPWLFDHEGARYFDATSSWWVNLFGHADARINAAIEDQVRGLGLETCMTLGMLDSGLARALKDAGLDYYNHNLGSAPELYGRIITTRTYQDRLDTLGHVREAGIKVCCGGIVGLGESRAQRAGLIAELANLDPYPESVPINNLVQVEVTPLAGTEPIDPFEFVRTIAAARITMPCTMVRLSAGREQMDDALQALCFAAGANSIFYGDRLLTTSNPQVVRDRALFERPGLQAQGARPAADALQA